MDNLNTISILGRIDVNAGKVTQVKGTWSNFSKRNFVFKWYIIFVISNFSLIGQTITAFREAISTNSLLGFYIFPFPLFELCILTYFVWMIVWANSINVISHLFIMLYFLWTVTMWFLIEKNELNNVDAKRPCILQLPNYPTSTFLIMFTITCYILNLQNSAYSAAKFTMVMKKNEVPLDKSPKKCFMNKRPT